MKNLKRLGIVFILIFSIYFVLKNPEVMERETSNVNQKEMLLEKKQQIETSHKSDLDTHLNKLLGKHVDELYEEFGDPSRKDVTKYGYNAYVYNEKQNEYIVFGIDNEEIVTVFGTGLNLSLNMFSIGDSYEQILEHVAFEEKISFRKGTSTYTIELTDDDILQHPLVKIGQGKFMQFYFDTIADQFIGVRYMTSDILLKQRNFNIVYRGKLPKTKELTDKEQHAVDNDAEQQIMDITNTIREIYNKNPLQPSDSVRDIAYLHSQDMFNEQYFSHENKQGESLSDRLTEKGISYQLAGENIAANYVDALAVVIGWLNSEGHRESLLHDEFTHIGVGVYQEYYTQNFIKQIN